MSVFLSDHARFEAGRRGIDEATVPLMSEGSDGIVEMPRSSVGRALGPSRQTARRANNSA